MSNFLNQMKGKFPESCQTEQCKKEGCSLTKKGLRSTLFLVDMDCDELPVPPNQKRCDYILFSDEGSHNWMIPIEMKRGRVDAGEIKKQLQAGTDFAASKLSSQDVAVRFKPLAVYGRTPKRFVYQEIKKPVYKVKFQAKKYEIELWSSGKSLADVLS